MHQFDVRVRVGREMRRGGKPPDERDAAMQREAERLAFRILKVGVPVFLVGYWAVCLLLAAGSVRIGLIIAGVVLSGVSIPVIVLPDAIRLWMEPDQREFGEEMQLAGDAGGKVSRW